LFKGGIIPAKHFKANGLFGKVWSCAKAVICCLGRSWTKGNKYSGISAQFLLFSSSLWAIFGAAAGYVCNY